MDDISCPAHQSYAFDESDAAEIENKRKGLGIMSRYNLMSNTGRESNPTVMAVHASHMQRTTDGQISADAWLRRLTPWEDTLNEGVLARRHCTTVDVVEEMRTMVTPESLDRCWVVSRRPHRLRSRKRGNARVHVTTPGRKETRRAFESEAAHQK